MAKIMIVEDDMIIAKGLNVIIKSIGNDIETTITGYSKEALKYAISQEYDMFLLDIQLLDYSGFELAKEIRNIDKYKLTPIVFITAIPTKELLAFKEIHCYDYIIKPFKDTEVIEAVSTLIKYRSIRREEKDNYLSLKQKGYIYRINTRDIIYIESIYKKIKVVTDKENIELNNYSLYKILEELSEDFIQCHKGFVINRNYIKSIDLTNDLIELRLTNVQVPIGRKYKNLLGGVTDESI